MWANLKVGGVSAKYHIPRRKVGLNGMLGGRQDQ